MTFNNDMDGLSAKRDKSFVEKFKRISQSFDLLVPAFCRREVSKGALDMSRKLDVAFIQPFIDGTVETLKVQCQIEVQIGAPFLRGAGAEIDPDIAGLIGIVSDSFNGSVALCFTRETFLGVISQMLGETYTEITKELEDGAGELMNIIFGFAKRVLTDRGHKVQKALPSVVRGQKLRVRHLTEGPVIILPFKTPAGAFQIEIAVAPL